MSVQRLRVSSWINPSDLMILKDPKNEKSPPLMTKDAKGRDTPLLNEKPFTSGKGILDDMTLQRSMNNDLKMNPEWDRLVLQSDSPASEAGKTKRMAFFQSVVDKCHQNNMQCLLGYTMMNPGAGPSIFRSFNEWLKRDDPYEDLTPRDHAEAVAAFLLKNVPECDGISFDIEGLGTGLAINDKMTDAVKEETIKKREPILKTMMERYDWFLGALAERLAKTNRIVGVATAGLTSATEVTPGYTAEDGFRIHQFTLATDHPNMLIRPMAYDNVEIDGKTDDNTLRSAVKQTLEWHDKVIAYALSVLPPERFQLGFKTILARNKETGKGPKYGGFITDVKTIRRRCEEVLRPQNIGIILFPSSVGFWEECNNGLNMDKGAPEAGAGLADALEARKKQEEPSLRPNPSQMPLDKDAFDRMISWRRLPMIPPFDY
jgi:hypothetical protein